MDLVTERMENLRWARILVKPKGGELPSSLEIGVEGSSYYLPLWWEGDGGARIDPRVEEWVNARLEALSRTADGTKGQVVGAGRDLTEGWIQFGSTTQSSVGDGIGGVGPEVGPMGSKGKEKVSDVVIGLRFGPARNGPSLTHLKNFGVQPIGPPALLRDNLGLVEIRSIDKGPLGKVCSSAQPEPCGEDNIEWSFLVYGRRKLEESSRWTSTSH
ncbi:hypothetical protein CK203_005480 [Vitis vinifera]|uniref:DUF4283 domain-containing protein n=1 Tax=Vitis vinifera TaxID=29760 RepID=A0A438K3F5_VITVI|nr:hypothetical protein CK203_005480 [Vitis vinifera]